MNLSELIEALERVKEDHGGGLIVFSGGEEVSPDEITSVVWTSEEQEQIGNLRDCLFVGGY